MADNWFSNDDQRPSGSSGGNWFQDDPAPSRKRATPTESALPSWAEGDDGFNFLTAVSNIPGDLVEIGQGVGTLGLAGLQDVGNLAVEAGTLGLVDRDQKLDDVFKSLVGIGQPSVLKADYQQRYGSVEGFSEGLEEDPLAFIMDALAVATGGGALAAKGAGVAAKGGAVADDLARLASDPLADIGRTAERVDRILPGAKQAAVEGDAFRGTLGGTRNVLDPTGTRVIQEQRYVNPVRRVIQEQGIHRLTRLPTKKLAKTRDNLKELVDQGRASSDVIADYALLDKATKISETHGIRRTMAPTNVSFTSLPSPRRSFSDVALRSSTAKWLSKVTGRHMVARDKFTSEVSERLKPVNEALGARAADNFHVHMQFDTPHSTGRVAFDEIENALAEPKTLRAKELAATVTDDIASVRKFTEEMTDLGTFKETPTGLTLTHEFLRGLKQNGREFTQGKRYIDQLSPEETAVLDAKLTDYSVQASEKARRYVESLTETLGESDDILSNAVDDVNLLRHNRMTRSWVGDKGPQKYVDAFDHSYMPLQRALKHKIEGRLKSEAPFTGVVDELYEALGNPTEVPTTLQIDDAMRTIGRKAPGYFPHFFPSGNKSDFLMKTGGSPNRLRPRSQPGVYKRSEGRLMDDFLEGNRRAYVTNPAEAYTRAASQIIRLEETEKFITDLVTHYGRPIDSFEEANRQAETVINLDGAKMPMRLQRELLEETDDYLASGQEIDKSLAEAIKSSLNKVPEELEPAAYGQLYAVPKRVGQQLQVQAKGAPGGKGVRLFHDGPVNMWRQYVLYTRPAYYVNNILGNTTFLKLQGGSLTGVMRQAVSKKYRDRVINAIPEDIRPQVMQGFHSDASQRARHMGEAGETTIGRGAMAVKESRVGRATGRVRDALQRFNSEIENAYRRESAMTAIEKQMSKAGVKKTGASFARSQKRLEKMAEFGADPKVSARVIDDVNKTMNDYLALQPFERNVVRRFIAPFYPFYKHSAITLAKMPFEHPGKARMLDLVAKVQEDMQAELGPIPEWLEGFLPVGDGATPGSSRFLSPRGANPFAGVFEAPLAQMSPAIQMAYEQTSGRDPFTGREFTFPDVYSDPYSGEKFTLDDSGQVVPVEKGFGGIRSETAPSILESLLGVAPPPLQLARDISTEGSRYTGSGEVVTDAQGNAVYPNDPLQDVLRWFGVSTVDYNLGRYQDRLGDARSRAANQLRR